MGMTRVSVIQAWCRNSCMLVYSWIDDSKPRSFEGVAKLLKGDNKEQLMTNG